MATQDDYIRTALRVPPDLHAKIHEAAKGNNRTFNAEIVERLSASLNAVRQHGEFVTDTAVGSDGVEIETISGAHRQVVRLLGYSLMQLSTANPGESADAAALRKSLRNLSILLGNEDLHGATVEASSVVVDDAKSRISGPSAREITIAKPPENSTDPAPPAPKRAPKKAAP